MITWSPPSELHSTQTAQLFTCAPLLFAKLILLDHPTTTSWSYKHPLTPDQWAIGNLKLLQARRLGRQYITWSTAYACVHEMVSMKYTALESISKKIQQHSASVLYYISLSTTNVSRFKERLSLSQKLHNTSAYCCACNAKM